jgi:hypothetical protein
LALILIVVASLPWLLDQEFSKKFELGRSFPQQQVMIYDLSKLGCWGHSSEVKNLAMQSLNPLLHERNNFESVCASLTPSGWDHLRSKIDDVRSSPVLSRIANEDEETIRQLQMDWINSILTNPYEWLLIKSVDFSQVMFMANTFYSPEFFIDKNLNLLFKIGDTIIKIPYQVVAMADKLRIFSIIFSLFFGVLLLMITGLRHNLSSDFKTDLNLFIAINFVSLIWLSITYVANNGRYAAPYIYLAYMYLLLAKDKSVKKL